MTKTVIARRAGDEYQDDWFWLQASRLMREGTPVSKVGYELEHVVGYDDVAVFYEKAVPDEFGDPVSADYFQVKFHVDYSGAFTVYALTEPHFIHSSSTSFLQRALSAQRALAPDGKGIRLFIVSPWPIDPNDHLGKLISTQNGEIRIDNLFRGGSRSAMGTIRKLWTSHLGLENEEELKQVLRPLRIYPQRPSQEALSEQVNCALAAVGFASKEYSWPGNPYHAIIRRLHREGHTKFSRAELTEACKTAGLYVGAPVGDSGATRLGIRSFLRWAEHLEDETDYLLDLLPFFDNREIRSQEFWNREVLPKVKRFLEEHIRPGGNYRLFLDTHSSIAFTAGHILDMKSGAHIVPMQRFALGRVPWELGDSSPYTGNEGWTFDEVVVSGGDEIALAVSVTHDTIHDVKLFVEKNLPAVGRIVHARIVGGPSSSAIQDGNHAFALAHQLVSKARQRCLTESASSRLHLFFAAPNCFVFFVGRHSRVLSNYVLYEYDFETNRPGGYRQSLKLPVEANV